MFFTKRFFFFLFFFFSFFLLKKEKVFAMSTVVGTWKEGGNLTLSEHVACIAAKHVGRYEDMIKELVVFFGGDTKKVEILKSCQERMRDVSNRFKEDRRAPRSGTNVPQLLNLAQELREKKKQFLIATQGEAQVEVTVGAVVRAGAAVQYLTPVKNLKTQRVKAPQSWRKKMLEKLLAPIFSTDDLTQEELEEATLHRERLKEQAEAARSEAWNDSSVEKENFRMAALWEVAFRALLAENIKKYDVYKDHSGKGDIRWNINVKTLTEEQNEVFVMTEAALAANIMQIKGSSGVPHLTESLEAERIRYEWFVKMYLPEDKAEKAVLKLEQSLGQLVRNAIVSGNDIGMKLVVPLAEESAEVKGGKGSLFSFFRSTFSRLRVGEIKSQKPTKSPLQVNHLGEEAPSDEELTKEMPEDVKEAYDVLMQRPISKHPQGTPVSETHRQKESTTVESLWQLKDKVDKVTGWAQKNKKLKKRKKEDSSSEEESKSDKNKKSKTKSKPAVDEVHKLEQRLVALESKAKGPPRPCYSFRDNGKCARGDTCKFSHERKPSPTQSQPKTPAKRDGYVELPDNICDNVRRGACKAQNCAANHGTFNKNSKVKCHHDERKQLCFNRFRKPEGCRYFHEDVTTEKNE